MAGYLGSKAVLLSTTAANVTGNASITGDLTVDTNTLFVDSANNAVGIGTSSPAYLIDAQTTSGNAQIGVTSGSDLAQLILTSTDTSGNSQINFADADSSNVGMLQYFHSDNHMEFTVNGTEAMRIDSSGNLLVGKTALSNTTAGHSLESNGRAKFIRDGSNSGYFGRLTSDGTIVNFAKDGGTVGEIGNSGNYMYLASTGPSAQGVKITNNFIPATTSGANNDNAMDLGGASVRWDDVYATNGTIQTSDANEKQDIDVLSDAEQRVAVAAKGLLRKFRWKDAVAEKGDDARIHFGIIAQDLQAAFEAEGLDAGRYAMFISSTWWEADEVIPAVEAQDAVYETQVDEDGNEVQVLVSEAVEAQPERTVTHTYETAEEAPEGAVERTRLGVRYPELLAFIIGAM